MLLFDICKNAFGWFLTFLKIFLKFQKIRGQREIIDFNSRTDISHKINKLIFSYRKMKFKIINEK